MPLINPKQLKSDIRQSIRAKRNNLSLSFQKQSQISIAKQLSASGLIDQQQNIACFLSFDGEISTHSIFEDLFEKQKKCYLPKLKPFKPNRLWFLPYGKNSPMINNRYGIPEVDLSVNQAIAVSQIDLVLLPLVAFDKMGNRLGMGGGFYDATFAHLKNNTHRPLFIGLAYEAQLVDDLPNESWDLPLDAVCTEQQLYDFGL